MIAIFALLSILSVYGAAEKSTEREAVRREDCFKLTSLIIPNKHGTFGHGDFNKKYHAGEPRSYFPIALDRRHSIDTRVCLSFLMGIISGPNDMVVDAAYKEITRLASVRSGREFGELCRSSEAIDTVIRIMQQNLRKKGFAKKHVKTLRFNYYTFTHDRDCIQKMARLIVPYEVLGYMLDPEKRDFDDATLRKKFRSYKGELPS